MKKMTLLLVVLLCAIASWIVAGSSTPAALTINDGWTGALVHSDGQGTYYDHSLSSSNPCVTAWASSSGLFFIYLDYNPAYGSVGQCDSALGIDGSSEDRTYSLTFASSGICTALGLTASGGECTLVTDNSPRIRADNLFARGASSTPVAFMFNWNGSSYSLNTNTNAGVSGSGTTRTASYNGSVTLWQIFPAPQKPKQVGSSFTCPFQFTVSD